MSTEAQARIKINDLLREAGWRFFDEGGKPVDYFTLGKMRKSIQFDRHLSLREVVDKSFGLIPDFKTKKELINSEFDKFISIYKPDSAEGIPALKYCFLAYFTDGYLCKVIENKNYAELHTYPRFSMDDFRAVNKNWRTAMPECIKDCIVLKKLYRSSLMLDSATKKRLTMPRISCWGSACTQHQSK